MTEEGNNFDLSGLDENLIGDLTPDIIKTGEWKDKSFQRYSIDNQSEIGEISTLHPLTRFTEQIRSIFLQMGLQRLKGTM